jgi:cysteinyl-tRNA synthetase
VIIERIKMSLKIYNTLTKKKEEFIPIENEKVRMYVCGMTVYSDAHIGHARTYFAFDVIRRYFEYRGFNVTYVQNITDVDDKIIDAANKEGVDALEYSKLFTEKCLHDLDDLGIRRANIYPKASETIADMIEMIKHIIKNGYGYESMGDVYFSVEKFRDYGKLSGQKLEDLQSGVRINPGDNKKKPLDFALWKKAKENEPFWDSPWGKGRPGWHIECSTMSSKYLNLPFDIHGGGMDLRFPHHENEIAQAEAATGKNFAQYWMHIGLLTVNGEKMSKSLGNIINIKDLLRSWDAEVIRFFFAQAHYRSPPDFSEKGLENAEKGLNRIYRLKEKMEDISINVKKKLEINSLNQDEKNYLEETKKFKDDFEKAMDDDFNTPEAIGSIFNFINKSNKYLDKNKSKPELVKYSLEILVKLGKILTLFQEKESSKFKSDEKILNDLKKILKKYKKDFTEDNIEKIIDQIINIREDARTKKDWVISDDIRESLREIGIEIQDTNNGPIWRKNIVL